MGAAPFFCSRSSRGGGPCIPDPPSHTKQHRTKPSHGEHGNPTLLLFTLASPASTVNPQLLGQDFPSQPIANYGRVPSAGCRVDLAAETVPSDRRLRPCGGSRETEREGDGDCEFPLHRRRKNQETWSEGQLASGPLTLAYSHYYAAEQRCPQSLRRCSTPPTPP